MLPSECYENAPVVLLEAYGVGTPVLGSDLGGIPELIQTGVTGYLANLMTTPATMHLHVMGSEGWARANGWMDTTKVTTCFGAGAVEDGGGAIDEIELPSRDIISQIRANDENFAAACTGEETYLFTPDEMAHTAAIHEAIAASAKSGKPTQV